MRVWRNGEGREFPTCRGDLNWAYAEVNGLTENWSPSMMRVLGYELVESDSPVTATASVEVQGGNDESVRLTILPRLRELRGDCQSSAKSPLPTEARLSGLLDILIDLYGASEKGLGGTCPSVAEPEEEFEGICVRPDDWSPCFAKVPVIAVTGDRLIPGELYSVRKVKR